MMQRTSKAWREAVDAVHGAESKYKRLVKAIAGEIESAVLVSGARLPPQRDVAAELGISVQTVTNATRVTAHTVSLTGLSHYTTYYVRVKSTDASGNTATSSTITFRTSFF